MRQFPPPTAVREIVSNRYFLARLYGFAGSLDLEAVLAVTDESFQAYDALRHEHGDKATSRDDASADDAADDEDDEEDDEEEDIPDFDQLAARRGPGDDDEDDADDNDDDDDGGDDNDDDKLVQRVTIPLYLPRGFLWEIEHYDTGDDSGVMHRVRAPGAEPVRFATLDAHPAGHSLRWADAERLFRAIDADPRNRAANLSAFAPLLLWSAIGLVETDDRDVVRARLAEAWRQSGVVSAEVADQLALESSRRRASPLVQSEQFDAFRQLLAALDKS